MQHRLDDVVGENSTTREDKITGYVKHIGSRSMS